MKDPQLDQFIKHIIEVIRQPELHMREIPIIIGIAILLIFIVLVLIAIVFVRPTNRRPKLIDERQLRTILRRRYIAIAALGTLAVISTGFAMDYSSRSAFCADCHEMNAAYSRLQTTVHSKVECLSCHQEQGFSGLIIEKFQLLEMTIAKSELVGDVSSGQVANEACLRCHRDVLTKIRAQGAIRMKHAEPLQAGYACVDCHYSRYLFHTEKVKLEQFGMGRCVDCHNQTKASAECSVCHVRGLGASATINRDEYPITELPKSVQCKSCHTVTTCLDCHAIQIPHSGAWKAKDHALQAFVDRKICWECHAQSACLKCHAGTFPHGENWVKQHGAKSKTAKKVPCSRCHTVEKFCRLCHSNTTDFSLNSQITRPKPLR